MLTIKSRRIKVPEYRKITVKISFSPLGKLAGRAIYLVFFTLKIFTFEIQAKFRKKEFHNKNFQCGKPIKTDNTDTDYSRHRKHLVPLNRLDVHRVILTFSQIQ